MLDEMRDSVGPGRFVTGTDPHPKVYGDGDGSGILQNEKIQTVGEGLLHEVGRRVLRKETEANNYKKT
jgi:hypothetical protein